MESSLAQFRLNPIAFLRQMAREHGDWAPFKLCPYPCILINDPRGISDLFSTCSGNVEKGPGLLRTEPLLGGGLLTAESCAHIGMRRRVQPAFARPRLAEYAKAITARARALSESWRAGETVDVHREMNRLTCGIIAETMFAAHIGDSEANEVGEALTAAIHALYERLTPGTEQTRRRGAFACAKARLQGIVDRLIAHGAANAGEDDQTLIALLLRGRPSASDGSLTEAQIRDEAMTFFLAGHESVANALSWTWYALSLNPNVAAKFHAEIDTVIGDRAPRYDDLPRLTYTRRVLSESLRLYPPAWMVSRRAQSDCTIGGHCVEAGTIAIAAQCVTHADARFFPNPDRFDPDRWLPERIAGRPRFSYFPFGAGTRACIGEQFAWTELGLILTAFAQRWELDLEAGHRVEMEPIVTLRPKYGMRMVVRERRAGAF